MKKIQLSVPAPCHEDWDKMNPVEKGRFCDSCQKKVIDFSTMSDREVAMFFKKPSTGSVCGRFMEDQLNRDIDIPRKRIPWVKYFFQFALPAFLISLKSSGQNLKQEVIISKGIEKISQNSPNTSPTESIQTPKFLSNLRPTKIPEPVKSDTSGFNECRRSSGQIVVGGAVSIKRNSEPLIVIDGVPQKDNFKLKNIDPNSIDNVKVLKNTTAIALYGNVSINGAIIIQTKKTVKQSKKTNDTLSVTKPIQSGMKTPEAIKVFPNPAKAGLPLNIEWKQSETGYFILQLFNQQGQMVFNKEMWIDDKASLLDVQLPEVSNGNYFIRMVSKQTGKSFSEKIIIQ